MTEKSHHLEGKRIIVAGCGIAGSTFIASLGQFWPGGLQNPPQVLVFDRQSRNDAIRQNSHILTLQGSTMSDGIAIIQQLRRLENVKAEAALSSAYFSVWNKSGNFVSDIHPPRHPNLPASAMRVSREHLMTQMIDKAERVSMAEFHWSCECVAIEKLPNGSIQVTTEAVQVEGQEQPAATSYNCDLLIVADGSQSKFCSSLRPSQAQTEYLGVNQIIGISHFRDKGLPAPLSTIDSGGMQLSDGRGFCCIYTPLDKGSILWAFSQKEPEKQKKDSLTREEFTKLKATLLEQGSILSEPFQSIIEATDPSSVYIIPAIERQALPHQIPGIVFLGDSSHECSMINPKGADLALGDGWDLAEQLHQSNSIEAGVAAYYQLSIPRAQAVADFTKLRIKFGHSTGAVWQAYKYGMGIQRLSKSVGSQHRE